MSIPILSADRDFPQKRQNIIWFVWSISEFTLKKIVYLDYQINNCNSKVKYENRTRKGQYFLKQLSSARIYCRVKWVQTKDHISKQYWHMKCTCNIFLVAPLDNKQKSLIVNENNRKYITFFTCIILYTNYHHKIKPSFTILTLVWVKFYIYMKLYKYHCSTTKNVNKQFLLILWKI